MQIELTEAERRICRWVAAQRRHNALLLARDKGDGGRPRSADDDLTTEIRGVEAEWAASIMLNLYWRPAIGLINQLDVGGLIEVKSTDLDQGKLIIRPKDKGWAPFVLVINQDGNCRIPPRCWIIGDEARKMKEPEKVNSWGAAHFMAQEELWPLDSLIVAVRNWRGKSRIFDNPQREKAEGLNLSTFKPQKGQ